MQLSARRIAQDVDALRGLAVLRTFQGRRGSFCVEFVHAKDATSLQLDEAFRLTKRNMQTLYESCPSWGWSDRKKRREINSPSARFLFCTPEAPKEEGLPFSGAVLAAFMHLRFLVEEGIPVTYVYEIQVAPEFQGQGIGAHLMEVAGRISSEHGLSATMLTVFNRNAGALQFYKNIGYSVDPSSPEWEPSEWEDGYTIMSKRTEKAETKDPSVNHTED